jgi:hypothetical protein
MDKPSIDENDYIEHLKAQGYTIEPPANQPTDYARLENRINELEARTGLLHPAWFTRAITAWLYVIGIQLIFGLAILLLVSVVGYLSSN